MMLFDQQVCSSVCQVSGAGVYGGLSRQDVKASSREGILRTLVYAQGVLLLFTITPP